MLEKLTSFVVGIVMTVGSFLGIVPDQNQPPVDAPIVQDDESFGGFSPVGGITYRLKTSVGTTDTTIVLSSLTVDGNAVTMTTLNTDIGYATLDPQSETRKEFVSFTTITQNSDGSATLTGVSRGLAGSYPYTASSTLRKAHPGQSIFALSDAPQVFNEYGRTRSNETVTGNWTFPTTTSASSSNAVVTKGYMESAAMLLTTNQSASGNKTLTGNTTLSGNNTLATTSITSLSIASGTISRAPSIGTDITNKTYVDGVAISGAPDADETTKGIVEEGTQAEVNAFTATGGTGASLYVAPDKLVGGISSSMMFYNATSSTDSNINAIPMTSGDILMMWAQFDSNSCISGSGNFVTGSLLYKQSNLSASTTVTTVSDAHSTTGSCNAVAIGMLTATTTMTVNVSADISAGTYSSVIAQLFIR